MSSPNAQGFLRHFQFCNRRDMSRFAPFYIDGKIYGWVTKELAALLRMETDLFDAYKDGLALASYFDDFTTRSEALTTAAKWIAERFGYALRGEMYPVVLEWDDAPLAQIDRAAVPWFGVRGFGVHVNGFVRKADGIHMWIGERAANRQIDPGKLDNIIGGGQPIGLSIEDNLVKEAKEEAGIESSLARTARRAGDISYMLERHNGIRNDTLFIYDLELQDGYTPQNTDGEVAAFRLLPIAEVAAIIRDTDRFKFNCNIVIIAFMVRHGFIAKTHPEYAGISTYLDKKSA